MEKIKWLIAEKKKSSRQMRGCGLGGAGCYCGEARGCRMEGADCKGEYRFQWEAEYIGEIAKRMRQGWRVRGANCRGREEVGGD